MRSLKKIIGFIGRRYGGRPFKVLRKFCYDTYDFMHQLPEVYYLIRKRFKPGSQNDRYCKDHYRGEDIILSRTGIVCICDGTLYHGGPTDRLRGILTTYDEARKRNIPFYISWTSPFNLEEYLVPSGFDWRIKPKELSRSPRQAFPLIIEDLPDVIGQMRLNATLYRRLPQTHVFSNCDNSKGRYAELWKELFTPSESLRKEIEKHSGILGNSYHAFTFRFLQLLGDFKDWLQITYEDDEAIQLMHRVKEEFIHLAATVPPQSKILITSDSRRFLDYIMDADSRIYIVPGEVKNIDLLKDERHEVAWMKTFIDQQLLMGAERVTLMRTGKMYKSGFPRFAAEVGGAEFVDHIF